MKAPIALARGGELGLAAVAYILVDYLRVVAPGLHDALRPILWGSLALGAASRAPWYPHWPAEIRSALLFVACLVFMLSCLVVEAISVQFVTSVLGLDWHGSAKPLPDMGQWLLLALNERLPGFLVEVLRAPIIGLHHYLMLFIMLGFSVLFGCVRAPGLALGARYLFTMGVGRLLRVVTFLGTILPSARPWCARARFRVPDHPHPWAQKYYVPYSSDPSAIARLLREDSAYDQAAEYPAEYVPNWGRMQFLANFLRPVDPNAANFKEESWFNTLKRAGGGCNDLVFSGHILVSVLTAMAWTEAYPGWSSVFIWLLVAHSSQREIRERHHYSVDVVSGIYVGILLWRTTGFIWSAVDRHWSRGVDLELTQIEDGLAKAAKDADLDKIRVLVEQLQSLRQGKESSQPKKSEPSQRVLWVFGGSILVSTLGLVLLAFSWTADG
ncbi:uncharacterized protein LOC9644978 [Selaginella moellendorffii]|nr:uncharacterized protein LOC9644978 [Selaginella moellendorffii]|eukprot:XP_002984615.2 uncharacterized protein LOC9644978 [Selaginella moellendorffii]